MNPKKLTPLEILQKQKIDLQMKSGELTESIENRARYLQRNFVPLLRNSVMESAVSKMPSPLRSLAGNFLQKETKTDTTNLSVRRRSVAQRIIIGIAEIVPFFLPGKKGAIFSILAKQVVKWVK